MQNWIDKTIGYFAPQTGLRRVRARMATHAVVRHYEAASSGRRTQGWRRSSADANAALSLALGTLRDRARDLVRNNGNADSALDTISDHTIGWGIVPKIKNKKLAELWKAWAESTQCDADGMNDFYGLQHLAMRTVAESGEVLIRIRRRRLEDGLAIPFQLQVLEADYIDTTRHGVRLSNGGRIVHGVELSPIGKRVAYWLYDEHPGSELWVGSGAQRVPAENILHIYFVKRPGQIRGVSWFATTLLRFKEFDEYEDATLLKQKIAACLAVLTTDSDASAAPLGTGDSTVEPEIDSLEPGMILNIAPGRSVSVVNPPSVGEYEPYAKFTLRQIASALGIPYEDLTGDYTGMPFSAARMSRLRHQDRVEKWRWQMIIPQMCIPIWGWFLQAAVILGAAPEDFKEEVLWTPPAPAMIDPANEGLAYQRNIRSGITTLSEALRERGFDRDTFLNEYADDMKKLDELGIILDSDARQRTSAGLPTEVPGAAGAVPPSDDEDGKKKKPTDGEEDEGEEDKDKEPDKEEE